VRRTKCVPTQGSALDMIRANSKSPIGRVPFEGLGVNGRRAWCPATLVSMLLNGGCGYEDDEPRPLLADQRRL
jgi:hypothetical protein